MEIVANCGTIFWGFRLIVPLCWRNFWRIYDLVILGSLVIIEDLYYFWNSGGHGVATISCGVLMGSELVVMYECCKCKSDVRLLGY